MSCKMKYTMNSITKKIKTVVLKSIKKAGGFQIISSSKWRQRRLLILCYHGFSLQDEHLWRPSLYMTGKMFEHRLIMLKKGGFNVLPFKDAVRLLYQDELPPKSVTLTVDDGFYDFFAIAYPVLKQYGIHATIYVSTWHVKNYQSPVFNLMVSYLFWSGMKNKRINKVQLTKGKPFLSVADILKMGEEGHLNQASKVKILAKIASEVGEDWEKILQDRKLSFMKQEEITQLDSKLVDVQLHTHRHRVPMNKKLFLREIEDNRNALSQCGIDKNKLIHFCYPSGRHHPSFLPWLQEKKIDTATTCVPGLANINTNPLLIPRFIDTSLTADIEFEAWNAGVRELLRKRVKQFVHDPN